MKLSRLLYIIAFSIFNIASSASLNAEQIIANPKAAQNKVAMCIGCHAIPNYKTTFPLTYSVPLLGGQNAKYIEKALKDYQSGERKHPSMRSIAGSLNEQDIADIAAYYSQQTEKSSNNNVY